MAGSKGYNSRAYVSNAPGAFYLIAASDFGSPIPVIATAVSQATGSIATQTSAFVKTTWITAEGESLPSAEKTVTLSTTTTQVGIVVTQPIVPAVGSLNGQTILGWRIYSGATTNNEGLNTTPNTTNFTVTNPAGGTEVIAGIAISSTSTATATIVVLGTTTNGQVPVVDRSGVQPALPSVTNAAPVIYYAVVPNSGSQWKQQKSVDFMKSDGIADPAGIILNHLDFIQPVYPGASGAPAGGVNPPVATYTQVSVLPGAWMVLNGNLFQAVNLVSASTATTFIGAAVFNVSKGTVVADGSVNWQAFGKAGLVRFAFSNSTSTAAVPAVQSYELFQS